MKKYSLYSLAVVAMLACAPMAQADSGPIAVVNIQQIMRDATAAKTVRDQLDSKQKTFQAEISKKQDALQKEEQDLAKKESVLSKSAFEEKKKNAFRAKVTDAQKEVDAKKALLDNAFQRALGDIQKSVTEIIAELAKDKGFTVAIPTSQLLYADPKLDISEEVLKRLNEKLPKVDVKFDSETGASK